MADVDDMRAWVRLQTLVESDDVSDAELLTYLNQAYYHIAGITDWEWLITSANLTTVASQAYVAQPTGYRRMIAIVDNSTTDRLKRLTLKQALDNWGGDFPTGADAKWYYVLGSNIYLVPTPTSNESNAYTCYYVQTPTALSAGTDTPSFASEYHMMLAYWAESKVWEREEDLDKAREAMNRYREALGEMFQYYANREGESPLVYGQGGGKHRVRANTPYLDDGSLGVT